MHGSKGVRVPGTRFDREWFLVRTPEGIYAYENSCPHTGAPLDWMPDQFLSLDKRHIQCATHHALFRIEDGYCVSGPCSGQSLRRVEIVVRNGLIYSVERE